MRELASLSHSALVRVVCVPLVAGHSTIALKIFEGGDFQASQLQECIKNKDNSCINIIGAESKEGLSVIIMEEGIGSLESIIESSSPAVPKIEQVEDLLVQVSGCLKENYKLYAHGNLKPSNVIVFKQPQNKNEYEYKLSDNILIGKFKSSYPKDKLDKPLYRSDAMNSTLRKRNPTKEEMLKEDTFKLGLILFRFICSLTKKELETIRFVPQELPEGRLKDIDKTTDKIPYARTRNLPKLVETIIQQLSPDFPSSYRKLIGSMLFCFKFEDRLDPWKVLDAFRATKTSSRKEEEKKVEEEKEEEEKKVEEEKEEEEKKVEEEVKVSPQDKIISASKHQKNNQ